VVKPELTSSYYSAPAVCYRNFFQKSLSDSWRKKENSTPFISFGTLAVREILRFWFKSEGCLMPKEILLWEKAFRIKRKNLCLRISADLLTQAELLTIRNVTHLRIPWMKMGA
jgi:hypothetical protein